MSFYRDTESFYSVMRDLFGRVMAAPGLLKPLVDQRAVLQMVLSDPDAVLVVDGRVDPPRFTTGMSVAQPDIGLRLPADILHAIWLSKLRLRDAFLAGTVRLDTSPLRALSLVNSLTAMFRYVEQVYPQVLRERGLLP